MADNVTANPGVGGAVLATDDIAGVQYPRVKVAFGDDGIATDASATSPLPVALSATQITALAPLATQPVSAAALGAVADAEAASGDGSMIALLKRLRTLLGASPAQDGTDGTSITPPTGGVGIRGWLSGIYNRTPALGSNTSANSTPVVIASDQAALQFIENDGTASGNITTQNLAPAGVATVGSAVEIAIQGKPSLGVQVTGTYTGALSVQATIDGTNWVTLGGVPFLNENTGASSATIASATQSVFSVNVAGFQRVRVTGLAAMTGTAAVSLRTSKGASQVTLDSPLPTGANTIGAVTVSSGTITTVSSVAASNLPPPVLVADIASAALTTTTTTAAFTPGAGISYEVNIPVTLVSGTTPTLDVVVQESDDSGTNWFDVYHFPRITAVGIYRSPKLALQGSRVRYVQTVGGTTPSFTRSLNRLQCSDTVEHIRQIIDRTLNAAQALNAVTATVIGPNCRNWQLIIGGAAMTTPPALQLEGSNDAGLTWYSIGTPLAAVANATVQLTVASFNAALVRARVSTAGVTAALNYVTLKGF